MTYITTSKSFTFTCAAVFIFSFINQINFFEIYNFLRLKGLANDEMDQIEIMEFLAAIVGGIVLSLVIGKFNKKKLLITSLITYLFCITNLILFDYSNILIPNLMLAYSSQFVFYSIALLKFVNFSRNKIILNVTICISSILFATICAEQIILVLNDVETYNIFASLAVAQLLTILCIYFLIDHSRISSSYQPRLIPLLRVIELEVLAGFTVTYIGFSIYWDGDFFAENSGYYILKIDQARKLMIYGALASLYPSMLAIRKCNKYKLNIYLILSLIISLIAFKQFGANKQIDMIVHLVNGAIIYTLFINNLIILTEKFVNEELDYAITIYLGVSIIGSYVGIVATDNMMDTYGNFGFLISLYSIAAIFLIYYLLQFFVRKLYRQ